MSTGPLPPRSKAASMFMAVPVVFGGLLMAAILSLLVLSKFDGCISGDRLQVQFQSACSESTSAIISERIEIMGLGTPEMQIEGDTITLVATFPGYLEAENETIPQTLSATGDLQLLFNDEVVLRREEIEESELDQDESGMPIVVLTLSEEAAQRISAALDDQPDGSMQFMLDGEFVVSRPNDRQLDGRTIRVLIDHGDSQSRMQKMADLNILLNTGVMPCTVQVESTALAN